ncbi:MAG: hypothetical protein ACKVTZ_14825 [Bacteroidia bacterium]
MAYSDFKMTDLAKQFGLKEKQKILFDKENLTPSPVSERLLAEWEFGRRMPLLSEKAKSEYLISPILKEVVLMYPSFLTLYSGYTFDVKKEMGLTGRCDYLFSTEHSIEIQSSVFCLVEAKDKTVEEGIPQAFAEMYAAQLFNSNNGQPTPTVYGCVTNAFDWLFLRLEGQNAYIDTERYYFDKKDLPYLLAVFQKIVTQFIPIEHNT